MILFLQNLSLIDTLIFSSKNYIIIRKEKQSQNLVVGFLPVGFLLWNSCYGILLENKFLNKHIFCIPIFSINKVFFFQRNFSSQVALLYLLFLQPIQIFSKYPRFSRFSSPHKISIFYRPKPPHFLLVFSLFLLYNNFPSSIDPNHLSILCFFFPATIFLI